MLNTYSDMVSTYLFFSALLAFFYVTYSLTKKRVDLTNAFSFLCAAIGIYLLGYLMELNSSTLEQMLFWNQIQYLGIPFFPVFWLIFSLQYTKSKSIDKPVVRFALFLIPILTFFFRLTNDMHHFYYSKVELRENPVISFLFLEKGPWYMVQCIFVTVCLIISTYVFLNKFKKADREERISYILLIMASFISWIGLLLNIINLGDLGIDYTALALPIICFLLLIVLFKYDLLKLKPMAREKIFESSKDGIMILNHQYDIIDFNPAAAGILKELKTEAPSKNAYAVLERYPELLETITAKDRGQLKIDKNNRIEHYYVTVSQIGLSKAAPIGWVITLADITSIKYLSFHDQLTGLYNRRFYEEETKRLDTERILPLSLVMADVNGLKLINDAFGHLAGDKLLQKAAQIIKKECRTEEIISRIGGDEFVILLPKTTSQEAELLVKRIKKAISAEKIESIKLSISFGWATKTDATEGMSEVFKKAEDYMYREKLFESPRMREYTIETIINSLYEKLLGEKEHAEKVSKICESIGNMLDFNREELGEIKVSGLLHDIGKINLNEEILQRPRELSDVEWSEIKRHPETGYRILSSVNDMAQLAEYVLAHHERWDGTGYPKGLKGQEISLQARVLALADAYAAMTTDRPYRKALSKEEAMIEIKNNSGTQFDPELVRVLVANEKSF